MTQRVEDLFDFMAVDDGTRGNGRDPFMLWPKLRGFRPSKALKAFVDAVAVDIEGLLDRLSRTLVRAPRLFARTVAGFLRSQAGEAGPDHATVIGLTPCGGHDEAFRDRVKMGDPLSVFWWGSRGLMRAELLWPCRQTTAAPPTTVRATMQDASVPCQ